MAYKKSPFEKLLYDYNPYGTSNVPTNPYDNGTLWSMPLQEEEDINPYGMSADMLIPNNGTRKSSKALDDLMNNYSPREIETPIDPLEASRNKMNTYTNKLENIGEEPKRPGDKYVGGFTKAFDLLDTWSLPATMLSSGYGEWDKAQKESGKQSEAFNKEMEELRNKDLSYNEREKERIRISKKYNNFSNDTGAFLKGAKDGTVNTIKKLFTFDKEKHNDLNDDIYTMFNFAQQSRREVTGQTPESEANLPWYGKLGNFAFDAIAGGLLEGNIDIEDAGKAMSYMKNVRKGEDFTDIAKNVTKENAKEVIQKSANQMNKYDDVVKNLEDFGKKTPEELEALTKQFKADEWNAKIQQKIAQNGIDGSDYYEKILKGKLIDDVENVKVNQKDISDYIESMTKSDEKIVDNIDGKSDYLTRKVKDFLGDYDFEGVKYMGQTMLSKETLNKLAQKNSTYYMAKAGLTLANPLALPYGALKGSTKNAIERLGKDVYDDTVLGNMAKSKDRLLENVFDKFGGRASEFKKTAIQEKHLALNTMQSVEDLKKMGVKVTNDTLRQLDEFNTLKENMKKEYGDNYEAEFENLRKVIESPTTEGVVGTNVKEGVTSEFKAKVLKEKKKFVNDMWATTKKQIELEDGRTFASKVKEKVEGIGEKKVADVGLYGTHHQLRETFDKLDKLKEIVNDESFDFVKRVKDMKMPKAMAKDKNLQDVGFVMKKSEYKLSEYIQKTHGLNKDEANELAFKLKAEGEGNFRALEKLGVNVNDNYISSKQIKMNDVLDGNKYIDYNFKVSKPFVTDSKGKKHTFREDYVEEVSNRIRNNENSVIKNKFKIIEKQIERTKSLLDNFTTPESRNSEEFKKAFNDYNNYVDKRNSYIARESMNDVDVEYGKKFEVDGKFKEKQEKYSNEKGLSKEDLTDEEVKKAKREAVTRDYVVKENAKKNKIMEKYINEKGITEEEYKGENRLVDLLEQAKNSMKDNNFSNKRSLTDEQYRDASKKIKFLHDKGFLELDENIIGGLSKNKDMFEKQIETYLKQLNPKELKEVEESMYSLLKTNKKNSTLYEKVNMRFVDNKEMKINTKNDFDYKLKSDGINENALEDSFNREVSRPEYANKDSVYEDVDVDRFIEKTSKELNHSINKVKNARSNFINGVLKDAKINLKNISSTEEIEKAKDIIKQVDTYFTNQKDIDKDALSYLGLKFDDKNNFKKLQNYENLKDINKKFGNYKNDKPTNIALNGKNSLKYYERIRKYNFSQMNTIKSSAEKAYRDGIILKGTRDYLVEKADMFINSKALRFMDFKNPTKGDMAFLQYSFNSTAQMQKMFDLINDFTTQAKSAILKDVNASQTALAKLAKESKAEESLYSALFGNDFNYKTKNGELMFGKFVDKKSLTTIHTPLGKISFDNKLTHKQIKDSLDLIKGDLEGVGNVTFTKNIGFKGVKKGYDVYVDASGKKTSAILSHEFAHLLDNKDTKAVVKEFTYGVSKVIKEALGTDKEKEIIKLFKDANINKADLTFNGNFLSSATDYVKALKEDGAKNWVIDRENFAELASPFLHPNEDIRDRALELLGKESKEQIYALLANRKAKNEIFNKSKYFKPNWKRPQEQYMKRIDELSDVLFQVKNQIMHPQDIKNIENKLDTWLVEDQWEKAQDYLSTRGYDIDIEDKVGWYRTDGFKKIQKYEEDIIGKIDKTMNLSEASKAMYDFTTKTLKEIGLKEEVYKKFDEVLNEYYTYLPHLLDEGLKNNKKASNVFLKNFGDEGLKSDVRNMFEKKRKLKGTIDEINAMMYEDGMLDGLDVDKLLDTNLERLVYKRIKASGKTIFDKQSQDYLLETMGHKIMNGQKVSEMFETEPMEFFRQMDVLGVTPIHPYETPEFLAKLERLKKDSINPNLKITVERKNDIKEVREAYVEGYRRWCKEQADTGRYEFVTHNKFIQKKYGKKLTNEEFAEEVNKYRRKTEDELIEIFGSEYEVALRTTLENALAETTKLNKIDTKTLKDDEWEDILSQDVFLVPKNASKHYNDISKTQIRPQIDGLLKVAKKVSKMFKASALVTSSFHINNAFGNEMRNFIQLGYEIFNPKRNLQAVQIANGLKPNKKIKNGMTYKEVYDTYLELGGEGTDAMNQFKDSIEDKFKLLNKDDKEFSNNKVLNKLVSGGSKLKSINPFDTENFALYKASRAIGGQIEDQSRFMNFVFHLEKGKTAEEAFDLMNEALFDYNDLSSFENGVMKEIIPFYTFMRKNYASQIENAVNNPKELRILRAMFYSGENKQSDKEKELAPDYLKNGAIPIGGKDYLKLNAPVMALGDLADPKGMLSSLNPLIKSPIEALVNRNFYNDSKVSMFDKNSEKVEHVLKSNIPLLGHIENLLNAREGAGATDPTTGENYVRDNARKKIREQWLGDRVDTYDMQKAEKTYLDAYAEALNQQYFEAITNNPELKLKEEEAKRKKKEDKAYQKAQEEMLKELLKKRK